jgi:hypothetical protein
MGVSTAGSTTVEYFLERLTMVEVRLDKKCVDGLSSSVASALVVMDAMKPKESSRKVASRSAKP